MMMTKVPTENSTNEINHDKIPENTVTIIIKSGGKIYSRGLTLPVITTDTPDEDVTMAMQRVRDMGNICVNTIFYTLKGHAKTDIKPELVDVAEDAS
jgi:hypothetical protein